MNDLQRHLIVDHGYNASTAVAFEQEDLFASHVRLHEDETADHLNHHHRRTQFVTLRIAYDAAEHGPPSEWDWPVLLDTDPVNVQVVRAQEEA